MPWRRRYNRHFHLAVAAAIGIVASIVIVMVLTIFHKELLNMYLGIS